MKFELPKVLDDLLNMQLYESANLSVTVYQLVIAILAILIGFTISRLFSQFFGKRLLQIKNMNSSTAKSIQQLMFYFLVIGNVLFSLTIAGIPITIFTVLGGAFAIGVGFSTQNTINNLISGIFILFEKPVRIGDIVELNNMEGKVEDIGHRTVRVRRVDGVDMLVPSSFFLDQIVVNWTLCDSHIRAEVQVGVAYGSDTSLVKSLLDASVTGHGQVLPYPSHEILFADFGDNALHFRLLFWVNVNTPLDRKRIESDIRFRIDKAFRSANIVIAFPQRDVHLNVSQPIKIQNISEPLSS